MGFQILASEMVEETLESVSDGTEIVTEDLSPLVGEMARLRPDVEFRVEEEKKVTRFLAHSKIVEALLGPADERVVIVKDVAGEAFGALLAFLYQPVNFELSIISIPSLLQLFLLAHRYSCLKYILQILIGSIQVVFEHPLIQGIGKSPSISPYN